MDTTTLEYCIANHFNPRINLIVPNVYWGFGLNYEADLIVVSKSGYATEIELKISKSDILADLKKHHTHDSIKIKKFYYAVPEELKDCEYLPENCGLLSVNDKGQVKTIRGPRYNKFARKLTPEEIDKLKSLCCMRVWSLKEKINSIKKYYYNKNQQLTKK